ncbi:MAG: zinc metallopeptidase [Oscillospiraceae bacterium]|nr:zinc metallopeptidase [Oscillospiraceae bacterium]MBQ4538837.1 zinc metallopeptidase [Oscillospiraceae bacterium]
MSYIVLVMPAILFSLWAQTKVNSTFSKYQRVRCYSGYTGSQIARRILDENGLSNVRVERVSGSLTDHYDPRTHVVRLSDSVYNSDSVAAIGVAAHETGHAVQHATGYGPLGLRNAIIPLTNFGSKLSMPLILLGLILNSYTLAMTGIIAFSMVALFQLITLPVEFNASRRAMRTLSNGMLSDRELGGARQVLTAAALTYVAALLVSAMQLLRLLLLVNRRRD